MAEIQPGENRGLYVLDGDALEGAPVETGVGLPPDRYEYIKVRLDREDPNDPPAIGTVTLDFVTENSIIDMRDGEEITINREVDFRGLTALKTSTRSQVSITGKRKPLQR